MTVGMLTVICSALLRLDHSSDVERVENWKHLEQMCNPALAALPLSRKSKSSCSGFFSCGAPLQRQECPITKRGGIESYAGMLLLPPPPLLSSNRSLHHFLGLCLTPSVMVHFTLLINNAPSPFHTFIFLPAFELQPLTAFLPPSHIRPFNSN